MKYLLVGNKGQLGKGFEVYFKKNQITYLGVDKKELDITNPEKVVELFKKEKPDVVINCAAYNLVDKAENEISSAHSVNERGVRNISKECNKYGSFLVHFSTNYVFDGKSNKPYKESDKTNPLSVYGKSKLAGEIAMQEELEKNKYLIFRLSWLYGDGEQNFIYKFMKRVKNNEKLMGTIDEKSTPTCTKLVVDVTMKALEKELTGLYHLAGSGTTSRWGWANEILNILKIDKKIEKVSINKFNLPAKRPINATLDNSKIQKDLNIKIPHWEDRLEKFLKEIY